MMPRSRKKWFRLTALILSTVLALILLEFAVRIVSPLNYFSPYLLQPYASFNIEPGLRYSSPRTRFSTNQWGMRGDDPPLLNWNSHVTILAVGGSTTLCQYLDDRKVWPYLFQEMLSEEGYKAWVGNCGMDGHTTRGHIHVMEQVVARVKPDFVVLLVGVNDLSLSLTTEESERPMPAELAAYRTFSGIRLFQIARLWYKAATTRTFLANDVGHWNYTPRSLGPNGRDHPTDLSQLPEFRRNVKKLIASAKEIGTTPIFMTQPMLYGDDERWEDVKGEFFWISEPRFKRLSAKSMWELQQIYNRELIAICEENEVPVLDLAAMIPHDETHFYDPVHFTDVGSQAVAQALAGFMLEKGLLGERGPDL